MTRGNNWRKDAKFKESTRGFTGERDSEGAAATGSDRKWSTEPSVRAISKQVGEETDSFFSLLSVARQKYLCRYGSKGVQVGNDKNTPSLFQSMY